MQKLQFSPFQPLNLQSCDLSGMPAGVTGLHHRGDLVWFLWFCLSVCDLQTMTFINIILENKDLAVLCPNNDRNCSCLCFVNIRLLKPVQRVILTVAN